MKLIDLHIHSTFSDGKLSIPQIVDFYGSRNFKIIAITDHLCEEKSFLGKASRVLRKTLTRENFQDYLQTIQTEGMRALKQYGMLVIPGIEITKNYISFKRSAHIVALGVSAYIPADDTVLEIISKIKSQGALAIAAHPVSTQMIGHQTFHLWDLREQLKDKFDAWEVASGPHIFDEVMKSGLPMIANSDFHHPKHIRSWKTVVKCELSFDALKEAIREQHIDFMFYEEPENLRINNLTNDLELLS